MRQISTFIIVLFAVLGLSTAHALAGERVTIDFGSTSHITDMGSTDGYVNGAPGDTDADILNAVSGIPSNPSTANMKPITLNLDSTTSMSASIAGTQYYTNITYYGAGTFNNVASLMFTAEGENAYQSAYAIDNIAVSVVEGTVLSIR